MKKLRLAYPLLVALVAALAVVLCFQLIPSRDAAGIVDYGSLRQAVTAAVALAALYLITGEWLLEDVPSARAFPLARALAVVALASVVIGAASVYVQGSVITPPRAAALMFVAMLAGTAVFEELLFRGFLFDAFARVLGARNVKAPLLVAAIVSSVLFGVLHVTADAGSLFRMNAYIQAAVKVAEGTAFGLVMCALAVKTCSVWPAVAAHFAFNVISELPIYLATGVQTSTYITGSPADIAVLAVGTACLLPAAKWAADYLRAV